jgi:hypothetical protein
MLIDAFLEFIKQNKKKLIRTQNCNGFQNEKKNTFQRLNFSFLLLF